MNTVRLNQRLICPFVKERLAVFGAPEIVPATEKQGISRRGGASVPAVFAPAEPDRIASRSVLDYPITYNMRKLLVTRLMIVGGWIGWWLGDQVGLMTAFILSMIGTGFGMYFGRRLSE